MKLGIMQPYFVPYIGYWQLMNAVDKYVIYDDVNFIKGGWINRNRILVNGQPKYFNIPIKGASPFKLINEIDVNNDQKLIGKNVRTLEASYKKAPYYTEVINIMERILNCKKKNIAEYIQESFQIINEYLEIDTQLIVSSTLDKDCSLKGQDKIFSICEILDATEYYNSAGGHSLYSFNDFHNKDIKLSFLKTKNVVYEQFGEVFQPNLSIVDVMMFNSKRTIKQMLKQFELINEEGRV